MAIEQINKGNIKQIRTEIQDAINAICEKHGLSGKLGNITYNNASFSGPLTVRVEGAVSPLDIRQSLKCGFGENVVHKSFMHEGLSHKIVGLKPNNKYSVITEASNGKGYRFPANFVKILLQK